ncbi:MAG TPA: glycine cleavage system aminomethyltransferase GcvT [Acidimicrobiales bacterium]|nr:glycine cleavage system aminomethyltransferase GcvT [Acidimicrobiales bacterium]
MAGRISPLDAVHRGLGARMVDFGGWEMPLSYPGGTLEEHRACREACAVFDVSHLGTVRVEGTEALAALQYALTNDLRKIAPGRAQYTHLLDEEDASVLDDIIVWWLGPERFDVMPNASNTERVVSALPGRDVTAERAVVAVQGPTARQVVAKVAPEVAAVGRFRVTPFRFGGAPCVAAGTGYTGEDGVECAVPPEVAADLWTRLVAEGAVPAGLGARDTLRLEAGLPLHGHELGPGITPLQAGLGWVVGWDKGNFRGRAPLEAERARGPARLLRGLVMEGRQPPRAGYVVRRDGKPAGEVTSGNFSPVLGHGIALAFLPPDAGPGDEVEVDMRGRATPARVVKTPFVARKE